MFSFFKKKPAAPPPPAETTPPPESAAPPPAPPLPAPAVAAAEVPPDVPPATEPAPAERAGWLQRLRQGLRKTSTGITQVFTGVRIDESLYEELESALLLADTGMPATEHLLAGLRRRVKEHKATDPAAVKGLLVEAIADLLRPLERALEVGRATPTVIMVVGVNGAGKTTSIGKLTRWLAQAGQKVLLAAADTFREGAGDQ